MTTQQIIGLGALFLAMATGLGLTYYFFLPKRQTQYRNLMGLRGDSLGAPSEERERMQNDPTGKEFERLKKLTRKDQKKQEKVSLEEKMFHAGLFSPEDKKAFQRLRVILPIITTPLTGFAFAYFGSHFIVVGLVFGLLIGMQAPFSILDRKIATRDEDIMFFLPLVIEQVAIGVSSSLDIGPCLQRIVQMADERDTHNAVTELVRHAQFHVKSGVSLEDALSEIGLKSGHTELKHAFMSLSQVAKHGGEITKQLQELADSVASQRETRIEAKIKKLELEATGPVALVFLGFLVILLIGFGIQIKNAF